MAVPSDPRADRREPRHRPCHRQAPSPSAAGASSPCRGSHSRRAARGRRPGGPCPARPRRRRRASPTASPRSARGCRTGGSTRWSTTPASRPRGRGGARLGVLESTDATLAAGVQRQPVRHRPAGARADRRTWRRPRAPSSTSPRSPARACIRTRARPMPARKAALLTLTREMAAEFAPLGVRINAIAPGEIDTAILSPGTAAFADREVPMRRLGRPEEVADGHLLPVQRGGELRQRRRTAHQRRPARLKARAEPNLPSTPPAVARADGRCARSSAARRGKVAPRQNSPAGPAGSPAPRRSPAGAAGPAGPRSPPPRRLPARFIRLLIASTASTIARASASCSWACTKIGRS